MQKVSTPRANCTSAILAGDALISLRCVCVCVCVCGVRVHALPHVATSSYNTDNSTGMHTSTGLGADGMLDWAHARTHVRGTLQHRQQRQYHL